MVKVKFPTMAIVHRKLYQAGAEISVNEDEVKEMEKAGATVLEVVPDVVPEIENPNDGQIPPESEFQSKPKSSRGGLRG